MKIYKIETSFNWIRVNHKITLQHVKIIEGGHIHAPREIVFILASSWKLLGI